MRKQTDQTLVLFPRALRIAILGLFAFMAISPFALIGFSGKTDAAVSSTINFQARLENATGSIAPDGNYNVEFKLYDAVSGGTLLWTEDHLNNTSTGVHVVNGYLTVNLGSVTGFGTLNWNQQMWLTMNIGNTNLTCTPFSSCVPDGEMSPRIQLTALPYAFQAGELGNGTNRATFDGSGNLVFQQASTIKELSAAAATTLTIQGGQATGASTVGGNLLLQGGAGTGAASGSVIVKPAGNDSTTAFQVQNAAGTSIFNVDTSNSKVGSPNVSASTTNSQPLIVATGASTTSGNTGDLTIKTGDATSGTTGNITVDNGTSTSGTPTINLGNTNAKSIAIGNSTGGTTVTIKAGTGNLLIQTQGTGTLGVGNNSVAQNIVIGNTTGATSLQLQGGSGGVQVIGLAAATSNSAAVCRDTSTNKLTACDSSNTTGAAFLQGGNNFGAQAELGTNDSNSLAFRTNNADKLILDTSGNLTFQQASIVRVANNGAGNGFQLTVAGGSSTSGTSKGGNLLLQGGAGSGTGAPGSVIVKANTNDSTTAFQVQNASGVALLAADTSNMRVSVGSIGTAASQLYVSGTLPTAAVGLVTTDAGPEDVYVQGNYLYETNFTANTFQIFDITNPTSPVSISSTSTGASSGPVGIYVQGRYAFVTNSSSNTLKIFDVSNPFSPSTVSTTNIGNTSYSVYVQGRYAYIANRADSTFQIFDISNPSSPVLMSTTSSSALLPVWVMVQGKYLYLANHGSGTNKFAIFDISNPASPVLVGGRNTTSGIDSIYVQGRYVYIASILNNALQIMDVSNPALPTIVATETTNMNQPNTVYVQGRYAYVTNAGNNTVEIEDVSNPTAPVSIGTVSSGGTDVSDVFVQGRYAYVSNFTSGTLKVFDVGGSYIQQLETGGILTGTLQTYDNVSVGGSIDARGGLQTAASVQVGTNLGVGGSAYIQGSLGIAGGIQGGLAISGISTPSAPTVTPIGGNGSTSYSYTVAAISASGGSTPASSNGSTATGVIFTSLSSSTYNAITWTPVAGAVSYNVYRTVGGTSQGLIGTTSTTTFNDTKLTASGTAPTLDTSGQLTVNGYGTFKNTVNSATAFRVQDASGSNLFTIDTSNTAIVLGNDATPSALTVRGGAATGTNAAGSNLTFDASNGTGNAGSGALIFRTASGTGTPVQDYVSAAQHNASTATLSWQHTVGNQSNRLLVVEVSDYSASVSSVTFGGTALTRLSQVSGSPTIHTEIWYLVAPAVGTGTVVVTLGASDSVVAGSASYYNVSQATPFGTPVTATNTGITASVTVGSTATSNVVISSFAFQATTGTWNPNIPFLWYDATTNGGAASAGLGSSTSTSVTWTNTGAGERWALIGVAINAAGGSTSASDTLTDRLHVAPSGNIGIGNSNPQYTLDIAGTTNVKTTALTALQVQNASGTTALNVNTSSISVGVGTAVPDAALSVQSSGQSAVVNIYGISSGTDYGVIQVSSAGSLSNASNRALVLQPNAGDVLLGTSDDSRGAMLTVNGESIIGTWNANINTAFQIQDASDYALVNYDTTDRTKVDNTTTAPNNLLENGGFESTITQADQGNAASGWDLFNAVYSIVNNSTNAHTGNRYLSATANGSTNDAQEYKRYRVYPGDVMYAEGWVNTASATGTGGFWIQFLDKDYNSVSFTILGGSYISAPAVWTKISGTATVPAGAYYVVMAASIRSGSTGTWRFDDILLQKINTDAPSIINTTTNTTTAFQIQNSSGSSLLTVDTTNTLVTLGSGAGTAVTELVLGSKTDTDSITPGTTTCTTSGAIYYNSSDSQFRGCRNGKLYNLIAGVDYQSFTSGTSWTKPSGVSIVLVIACGAGGGGGGGRGAAAGSSRQGGAGGGGGTYVSKMFYANDLGSTVSFSIGTAGTSGASNTAGGAGGATTFGTGPVLLTAPGGGGGGAGPSTAANTSGGGGGGFITVGGTGGASATSGGNNATAGVAGTAWVGGGDAVGSSGNAAQFGGGSGGGTPVGLTGGLAGGDSITGGAGGGGGGSVTAASPGTESAGGNGGGSGTYGAGGGAGGGAAHSTGTGGSSATTGHCGTGGGGGGGTNNATGAAGGAGGTGGGGGGGGGGGTSTGGAGGAGGSGELWVISW